MSPTPADPMWEALPEGPGDPRPGDARPDDPRPDDIASSRDAGLWPGDRGSLPDASRRALLALLRGPYLAAARNPALWNALLRDQDQVTARLHDLYCDLVLDVDSGVAFVRNVDAPDLQAPRAVRTAALTFLDSAMLLVLRQHLLAGEGERIIVGKDEIAEQLEVYRGAMGRDESDFERRVSASWSNMDKHGLIQRTDVEGRFEISPILRLLVGPDQVAEIRAAYTRMSEEHAS